ncbi:MAG: hypothetical protein CMP76_02095 [Flavobacterium sp.]|uniref:hypothetical protein n=1 Tax=Flavobacterium sp. TaxID=239 RepID=UPI000C5338CE|nr:hypothetical protein [Flavobacterium sp.]MBF02065.1 hypothetical protein [Flavobacterium sp.]|tara:strand:+ start:333 stop:866 length:534 start_codon:yes stop_codon:yes gene_type:complete
MKKAVFFFSILLAMVFTLSCRSKKVTETKTIEIKSDSLVQDTHVNKVVEISKAVSDSSATYLPNLETGKGKDCDSLCNEKYRNALKSINFYKKSGENSYKMFYDEKSQLLYTIANMQQTINTKTDSISKLQKKQYSKKEVERVVEKKVYPKWFLALAFLGVLFIIFLGYRFSLIFKP